VDFNTAGAQREPGTVPDGFLPVDEAKRRLRDAVYTWVPRMFPRGRFDDEGNYRLANIEGDPPKKSGSCVITMKGEHAGSYKDWDAIDAHGGPIQTVGDHLGLSGAELFDEIKRILGEQTASSGAAKASSKPKRDHSIEIAHTLKLTAKIAGTAAETYFAARGITDPIDTPDLLFNPTCTHFESMRATQTIVARFTNLDGTLTGGIHRIYLRDDGSWHIGKKSLGPVDGGVIRLADIGPDGELAIGEGIETTLAGMQLYGLPGWAAGFAGNMIKLAALIRQHGRGPLLRSLTIFADRDKAGFNASTELARAARDAGIDVVIRLPIGKDFADDLQKGVERSRETLPISDAPPSTQTESVEVGPDGFPLPRLDLTPEAERRARRAIRPAWLIGFKKETDDVVEGLVPNSGLGLIIGKFGSGKSFFGLHMASCLSRGVQFFDRDVPERVGCLYIAAEAGESIDRRVAAHHFDQSAALGFIMTAFDFGRRDSGDILELIEQIHEANNSNLLGEPIRMIFVDTLARSGLQNENDPQAMAALVENCDAIRTATGAIVVGIHHQGWEATHSRGHSSLPAAVDFEITLTASDSGVFTAQTTKSRDGVTGSKMAFRLNIVRIGGTDEKPVTTCLVEPVDAPTDSKSKGKALNQDQKIALAALVRAVADEGFLPMFGGAMATRRAVLRDQWTKVHLSALERPADSEADSWKRGLRRHREWLQANGIVVEKDGKVWPADDKADRADNGRTEPNMSAVGDADTGGQGSI
jgi:hypothetical protein